MSQVKINLFTVELKPLGEYYASTIPREGEHLNWDGELYLVHSVTWEGLPESAAVQVRLGG